VVEEKISVPLVSVIMPTYNRASLLNNALKSALNQTYPNLEIVVVDDASTDKTKELVEGLNSPIIKYIQHSKNRGGSAARNTGINNAIGEYVAFLDDDDEWEPNKTKEQVKVLQTYDAVLCTSNEEGLDLSRMSTRSEITLDDFIKGHFTAGGTGVLMVKAFVIRKIMFDERLPRGQDWDVFIRISQQYKVGYLNLPLVKYNEGTHERISNNIINMSVPELMKSLLILEKHKIVFGPLWYKRHLSRYLLYGIRYRKGKIQHIALMIRECGIPAVVWSLYQRIRFQLLGSI